MQAIWNNTVLAESDDTLVVEGNHYFPRQALVEAYFEPSETHTHCPWKGEASYLSLRVGSERNPDAAWFYVAPKAAAKAIEGRVAFWRGVELR